jgi:zinc/manganese transport system ATP-binding protein
MTVVEFHHASIGVGSRTVLSDISIAIEGGEFVGVLGPNGAGKTTLMHTILGLLKPSAGDVRVFGKPPRRGNPAIGYLPQQRSVRTDVRMRGRDFIACSMHGERWGLPVLSRADRYMIDKTLARAGAGNLADRRMHEMSGGERQRLLLAQALLGSPQLLLLDEPLISLDSHHQENAIDFIRLFSRERGIAVMFSAHELNQLLGVLDRVLYLGGGHAALGTVEEVVTAPVLSRLYGTDIDVIRTDGHIFVVSRGRNVERTNHLHDYDDHPSHVSI